MVSIIIPTYNRAYLIRETLESIIIQSYKDWECIIIDDDSQDNTAEVINHYINIDDRFRFFTRPKELPKGANSCRNYGLENSRGKYIKWMDSDDLLTSNCLFDQVSILEQNDHIQLCLGYSRFFNNSTGILGEFWSRSNTSNNYISDHIKNLIRWGVGDVLWRKEGLKNSPFHNHLKNSQEWLMHGEALLALDNSQIYNFQKVICLIRRGHNRMSSNRSSTYYANQLKARYLLIMSDKRKNKLAVKDLFSLHKQILVYLFYTIKSKFFK